MPPHSHPLRLPLTLLTSAICLSSGISSVSAAEPKRVLVVTITTGFRHSSIETAERILLKLAHESKDFLIVDFIQQPDVVVPKKPTPPRPLAPEADDAAQRRFAADTAHYQILLSQWTPDIEEKAKKTQKEFTEQLAAGLARLAPAALENDKIDGVIFANTTGDLPLPDKDGFIQWIEKGHAIMGMHSATDTLRAFPAYTALMGGEFAGHGSQSPIELISMDPKHPGTSGLSTPWHIKQEELYRFKGYERTRVHDLWSAEKNPMDKRPDQGETAHFPVSWVRTQGMGKIFYTSLGHREDVWDDNKALPNRINPPEVAQAFQKHILGGIRWALGLAEGDAEPQVK